MKLITLCKRNTSINYKNSLFSFATLFVISVTVFAIVAPFYIAFSLFNDLWSQYKIVYEQPDIRFEYKYIFTAEFIRISAAETDVPAFDTKVVVCSSYKHLNKALNDPMECSMIKVNSTHVSLISTMAIISQSSIFSTGKRIRISTTELIRWHYKWRSNHQPDTTWTISICSYSSTPH